MGQFTAIVGVGIGSTAVTALRPHTGGIVEEVPSGATLAHRGKLASVLPSVCPSAVVCDIANFVALHAYAVNAGKYIAPAFAAVGEKLIF